MSYGLRVLITDESTLTLALVADALKKAFANSPLIEVELLPKNGGFWNNNPAVVVHDHEIEDDWTISISESEEPMDSLHHTEILEAVMDYPEYQKIASCKRWFNVVSDKDYDQEYLDVYAVVAETLSEFPEIYVFDVFDIDPVQFPPRLLPPLS